MDPWKSPAFYFKPRYKRDGADPVDTVVLSAKVLVCDEAGTKAQAVGVKDGRFVYVGDNAGAKELIGAQTRVINARGRTLTPGFIDNHVHLLWMGMLRAFIVDLYDCTTIDDVIASAKAHAEANPDLPIIMGIGWRYDLVPGGFPDQATLDAALPDRPAFLLAYDACTLWTNTPMHELMLEKDAKACRRMKPDCDEKTGEPTGLFLHSHSFDPFEFLSIKDFPKGMKQDMLETMREAVDRTVAAGVTTFDELQVYKSMLPMILELRDTGGLDKVRARAAFYVDPIDLEDEAKLKRDLRWWKKLGEKESGPRLKLGTALKLYIDGTFGNHTSFMLEPFSDTVDDYGYSGYTQESFDRLIEIADDLELQTCTHAIGDAGIQRLLNSIERSQGLKERRDMRHRIEHCELPLREDIGRMARLGVQAGMQPTQFFGDESFERTLGMKRLQRFHPWRSIEKAGINISFGTDWIAGPDLPPINPLYGLVIAATRINYHMNTDWAAEEKIDIEDAIRHYTLGGAKALFMEDEVGSVEVGKHADFVLWSTDLLKIASWWFLLTNKFEVGGLDHFVEMTFVDGKAVYIKGMD